MRLLATLAMVVVVALCAGACGGTSSSSAGGTNSSSAGGTSKASPLVGKWIPKKTADVPMSMDWVQFDSNEVSAGFFSDSASAITVRGSWKVVGNNLIECVRKFTFAGVAHSVSCTYRFAVTADTLTLKDLPDSQGNNAPSWVTGMQGGWTVEFTRQK